MKKLLMMVLAIAVLSSCHKKNNVKLDVSPTVDTTIVTDTIAAVDTTAVKADLFSGDHKYYVVVGSFKVEWRAQKWAKKIDSLGYTPEIVFSHNEFYMVYVKGVDEKKYALSIMENVRNCVTPRAWCYVKR